MYSHLFAIEKTKLRDRRFRRIIFIFFAISFISFGMTVSTNFMLQQEGSHTPDSPVEQAKKLHNETGTVIGIGILLIALHIGFEFRHHIPHKHLSSGLSVREYFWMKFGYAHLCWLIAVVPTVIVFLVSRIAFPDVTGFISWWKGSLNLIVPAYGMTCIGFSVAMVLRSTWQTLLFVSLALTAEHMFYYLFDKSMFFFAPYSPLYAVIGLTKDPVLSAQHRCNYGVYAVDQPLEVWLFFVGYILLFTGAAWYYTKRKLLI